MSFRLRRLGYALGAEVIGLDLRRTLPDATIAAVRAAWLDHQVLLFRDQDLTPAQHVAFSRRFGELELHPNVYGRHADHPEIFVITNKLIDGKPSDTRSVGRQWHSDGAYTVRPSLGSLLHARELPPVGGDTLFCNMVRAYETLSPTMRAIIDDLWAIADRGAVRNNRTIDPRRLAQRLAVNPPVVQPMVRTHDETGRKALYVSDTVTTQIEGMTREESRALLDYLFRHSVREHFVYRHQWQLHDLLMWDNRSTMHLAPPDYDPAHARLMLRTTLAGVPCGRLLSTAPS